MTETQDVYLFIDDEKDDTYGMALLVDCPMTKVGWTNTFLFPAIDLDELFGVMLQWDVWGNDFELNWDTLAHYEDFFEANNAS